MNPSRPNTGPTLRQALEHHRTGRLGEAEVLYREILAVEPNNADALHLLGVLAAQGGYPQDGLDMLDRAIAIAPGNAGFHANRGNILRQLDRQDEAADAYRLSIELDPSNPLALNNLGNTLRDMGRREDAIGFYQAAIKLHPDFGDAHTSLGNSLRELGRLDEALAACREAVRLQPNHPGYHSNLGIALADLKMYDEAIAAYEAAITLEPRLAAAYVNLSHVYLQVDRLTDAVSAAFAGCEHAGAMAESHVNLGNALIAQGRVDEAIEAFQNGLQIDPSLHGAHSNLLLTLHNRVHPPEGVFQQHKQWARTHAEPLASEIRSHTNNRDPNRKLRVGFISADLRDHQVGRLALPLFEHHDRGQFDFVVYSDVAPEDAATERFRKAANEWNTVASLTDAGIADLVRSQNIDILVDLHGHTAGNRLLALARKPAPVQVTMIGYPDTTGISTIDYRITDAIADPPGVSDSLHTEKLVRLHRCFIVPVLQSVNIANAGAPDRSFTFGCFNNFTKVSPQIAGLWARILRSVPEARLVLRSRGLSDPKTADFVRESLAAQGVPIDRVELLADENSNHLDRYNAIDVALDTFPYSGTSTTIEALSMGVPVITRGGETHASRVSSSLLTHASLTEWIARDEDHYVDLGIAAAKTGKRSIEDRKALRDAVARSPLCDEIAYTKGVEAPFRAMWKEWCSNPG